MTLVLIANAGDGTVSALRLDGDRLTPLATSPVGPGVGTFAVDPDRDLVYAGVKADGDAPAAIVTLALDRATGQLSERSRRAVDDSMTYLSLTDDRRFVLGASYGGGFGGAWPVSADGEVGEARSRIDYPNLHCVVTEGDLAYFVSLGADLVAHFRITSEGRLQPLGELKLPEGCGPRHLELDGANAYLVTEYSGEVFQLSRDDQGDLTRRGAVSIVDPSAGLKHSRMGADPKAEGLIWGADLHRVGGFLLATERTASTIATVPVAADGSLSQPIAYAPTVEQPRGFNVTADQAIVVGERATDAQLFRVEADGTLSQIELVGIGAGANWVRVLAA